MMDAQEFLRRVRDRGGQVRVLMNAVQYRPARVLSAGEVRWLHDHCSDVIRAVEGSDPTNPGVYRRWVTERFGLCVVVGWDLAGHPILLPLDCGTPPSLPFDELPAIPEWRQDRNGKAP
jgi:hypothetical protein